MSDRITRKQLDATFARFVAAMGGSLETWTKDADGKNRANVGAYQMDCNGVYGGCVVERLMSEGGGVDRPFGDTRRPMREMYDTLRFAIDVLHESR